MDEKRQIRDPYTLLAFYGIEKTVDSSSQFYDLAVTFARRFDCLPNKAAIYGEGFSGRLAGFARADNALRQRGFERVTDISLTTMCEGGEYPAVDYVMAASWSGRFDYACITASASFPSIDEPEALDLARNCADVLKPSYGLGTSMEHSRGPAFYAGGILQGPSWANASPEEKLRISRWGHTATPDEVYRQGVIRDVYRWNFLNETHLKRLVHDVPLEEWTVADPRRGQLKRLTNSMWFWEVEERDVPDVRSALWDTGVIFH